MSDLYYSSAYGAYDTYGSSYGAYDYYGRSNSMEGITTWLIIAAVVAVIGGLVLYFTFLSRKNEGKYKGFLGWTYEFLNFKRFTIESFLKITYLMAAIFTTLGSFAAISESFLTFLLILIGGNLLLRVMYEFSLVMLIICRNTIDINNKLIKKEDKKDEE